MKSLMNYLEAKRALRENESAFSLIDVVITVAIVVALSVGGFIAYNGIVDNARQAAVDSAATNVYKAALVYESDGDMTTNACTAVDEYNSSSEGITVELIVDVNGVEQTYVSAGMTLPEDAIAYTGC